MSSDSDSDDDMEISTPQQLTNLDTLKTDKNIKSFIDKSEDLDYDEFITDFIETIEKIQTTTFITVENYNAFKTLCVTISIW